MDVGLLLRSIPPVAELADHIARLVVLTTAEAADDIVLDDVVQLVLAQPLERLVFAVLGDGRMNHVLAHNGHSVDVEPLDTHLVHETGDDLRCQRVLFLLQCLDVALSVGDLVFQRPHFPDVARELGGSGIINALQSVCCVEDVVENVI